MLTNGSYVVCSAGWRNGTTANAGAVTFGNATTGVSGPVSAANSLVGTSENDRVGAGKITELTNGNCVVLSPYWSNGTATKAGAVTFIDSSLGISGVVSAANSLVGSNLNDMVGFGSYWNGVVALNNGNYIVSSTEWNNSKGAVTFGNGTIGVSGVISAANSLVGSTAGDKVGGNRYEIPKVVALANGNYVVLSENWSDGLNNSVGAITFASGTTGITGPVSSANSLVGSTSGDYLSSYGYTVLANGNLVVLSPEWTNGTASRAGAATFINATTGMTGTVSAINSLVGTTAYDEVGRYVIALKNGNYVTTTRFWDNGTVYDAGAVTFGNGTTGVTGAVSAANSLVGSSANDQVGGYGYVNVLANGNYLVFSPTWDNGSVADVGAVTLGNGTTGIKGLVNMANSLVGSTSNDQVGSYGRLTELPNGNYLVSSPEWDNGLATNAGAVTFVNGTSGIGGIVTSANSLVGSSPGDRIGDLSSVSPLANGNYIVRSAVWDNGAITNAGAMTFGNGTTGVFGSINNTNSAVGAAPNSGLIYYFIPTIADNVNGTFFGQFLTEIGGRVRVGSQTTGFAAPKIASILINNAAAQRSRVTSLTITFNQVIMLPAAPDSAFKLSRQGDGMLPALTATVDNSGPGTVVTLTFTGNNAVDFGSLADGRYTLSVLASQINSGFFDGNSDGTPGDDYLLIGTPDNGLFRLFGDSDGNGAVNSDDFAAFRDLFGMGPSFFDFNNDGLTNSSDFIEFRKRFGLMV
jgi:hypothetical protein